MKEGVALCVRFILQFSLNSGLVNICYSFYYEFFNANNHGTLNNFYICMITKDLHVMHICMTWKC